MKNRVSKRFLFLIIIMATFLNGFFSGSGTFGAGRDYSGITGKKVWVGRIEVRIAKNFTRTEDDYAFKTSINEQALYSFTLQGPSGQNEFQWRIPLNGILTMTGSFNDKTESPVQTWTIVGSKQTECKIGLTPPNIILNVNPKNAAYSLDFPKVNVTVAITAYEDGSVWQGPDTNEYTIPGQKISDIPLPQTGNVLKGSRKVIVKVAPPFGGPETSDPEPIEAVVSWELQ